MEESDLVVNTVDLCIMPCALERRQVLLDGVYSAPAAGEGEGDGVAADAAESVEDDFLRGWGFGGDVLGEFAGWFVIEQFRRRLKETHLATASCVTPYQASSVIRMPSS